MESQDRHGKDERTGPCRGSQGSRPEERILGGHGIAEGTEILEIHTKHAEQERVQNPRHSKCPHFQENDI